MAATVASGLVAVFVLSGPARGGQFGACLGDDGRFLGTLDGGTITPVQQPRHNASGADRDDRNGRQQHEGNERIDHPCPLPQAPRGPASGLGERLAGCIGIPINGGMYSGGHTPLSRDF